MEVMVIFRPSRTKKQDVLRAVASEERMMMIPLLSAKKTQLNLNPMGHKKKGTDSTVILLETNELHLF